MRVDAGVLAPLIEPALGARGIFGGRHPKESDVVAALEVDAGGFKLLAAFEVDKRGGSVWEDAVGIGSRWAALRFDKDGPSGPEAAQCAVEACRRSDQLCGRRAIQVRASETGGSLERAILVEDHAGCHEGRPGQIVGKACGAMAIFGEVHHRLTLTSGKTSDSAGAGAPRP